jgi:hypothetical protein
MNCKKYARAAILALVISSAVEAEAVVIQGTIGTVLNANLDNGPSLISDELISLPKFDSRLGTLNGVSLTLDSLVNNSLTIANTPSNGVLVTFTRNLNFGDTQNASTVTQGGCAAGLAICDKGISQDTFNVNGSNSLAQQEVKGTFSSFSGGLGQFIGSGLSTDTKPFYFSAQTFFSASGGTLSSVTAAYTPSIQYSYSYIAAVPEPEIYAMMLAGLSVLGFVARRKHKKPLAA